MAKVPIPRVGMYLQLNKSKYALIGLVCIFILAGFSSEVFAAKKHKIKAKTTTSINQKYVLTIPYASLALALKALEERKDLQVANSSPLGWTKKEDWKIFKEHLSNDQGYVEWAFTPASHPAHPALIKRYFDIGSSNHIIVDTVSRCGGNAVDCSDLLKVLANANRRIFKMNERNFVKEGEFLWKDTETE